LVCEQYLFKFHSSLLLLALLVTSVQEGVAADTLLYFCKRLWGQPYLAPIFALLIHKWLLLRPEAGGIEQRQKHVNVLMLGECPCWVYIGLACSVIAFHLMKAVKAESVCTCVCTCVSLLC
jgi:hypothetical protein